MRFCSLPMIVALGLASLAGCNSQPRPARLAAVVQADPIVLTAPASGLVVSVRVQPGQSADGAEPLAALESPQLDSEISALAQQAKALEAQARQAERLADLRSRAAADTERWADQHSETLRRQQEQAVQRLAELQQAQPQIRRRLASGELVLEENDAGLLRVELAGDRARLLDAAVLESESARAQAHAASELAKAATGPSAVRARAEAVQRRLAELESRAEGLAPRAPSQGLIVWQAPRRGAPVRPGDPVLTLYDPRALWVSVAVEESAIRELSPGSRLPVELPGGVKLEATVESVSAAAAFATQRDVDRLRRDVRAFDVRLRLPPETPARPGMTAYVKLADR